MMTMMMMMMMLMMMKRKRKRKEGMMKKREKKKKKKKIGNQTEESTSLPLGKAQSLHFWILEEQRGAEGGHSTNWEIWEQSSAMGAKRFGILTSRSHRNIGVPFSQRASCTH